MKSHCLNCYHLSLLPYQDGYSDMTPSTHAVFRCGAHKWDADDIKGGRAELRALFAASETCDKFVPDEPSTLISLDGSEAKLNPQSKTFLGDKLEFDLGGPTPCPDHAGYIDALKNELLALRPLTPEQTEDLRNALRHGPFMRPGKPDIRVYTREGRTSVFRERLDAR